MSESIQLKELKCDRCDHAIAIVQIVPGTLLITGEVWCPECFDVVHEEED